MKIAFNPSNSSKNVLDLIKNNKDIIFDLKGHSIYARGVEFKGTDTQRPVVDNLTSNSATSSLSANQGRVLAGLINGKSDSDHNHDDRYVKRSGDTMLGALNFANGTWNLVGDNVYMGDHNIGGQLCIMGANGTTGLSFHKYGDASIRKSITFDGNTLYMNGSCDYATLSNQTNLLAINTVPNKTAATSIGSWSPISGRYVFHQKWTDTSTGGDTADFGIYLDGNLTANMVLDGYYNSLLGFRVIGATGGFLKANGTIDNSTYLTSHQSLSNYYTKGEIDNQLGKYKLKSSIWVPETKVIRSNFRDFLNKENLHKQAPEELNLYRFFAQNDESNYSSKYNYPVVDSHAMVFSIDGNNSYIRSMNFDLRSNDIYVTSRVAGGEWRNWVKLLDSSNYSGILDSRYYTESEINSLLDAKLNRQNLSYGTWNPRGYHLAADYHYNGGDLSISENSGQIHVSINGYFWQNEGKYKVLDTSDVAGLKGNLTVHQYLSATDVTWWPLIWGGNSHNNTNDSTGAVYKSHDKLSWQTGSQTLYATNIQTENIRHLSIGGGIYWNPNVESASDGSDAASITLVKSGVAGGTTLVLSQMNDANDTIQFKTNAAARLYHNSYPILTIQNTYVSNGKGYINGTEITQVNNSDTIDGWHKNNIQWTGYITSENILASYWFKMYDITVTRYQYNDITITFLVSEGFTVHFSIFYLRIRQNGTNNSGNYNLSISLCELVGNLRDKVVAYYNNSTGNVQLWGNTGGQWDTMNYTVLKKTTRAATDSASLGTLTAQLFSSVQTPPSTGYSKVTMSGVGSVSYSDSTGSVHWNNVTNKPSSFTPSSHTHTWTSITDKIVVNNEFNIVNAGFKGDLWFNYLPINDRSKSATIKSYRFANGNMGYTSLVASGFIINGGTSQQLLRADGGVATFNWTGQSGQPTWLWGGNSQHSYYLYNPSNFRVAYAASAGNADTLDGWHKNNIQWTGYITSENILASYWFKMYDITVTRYQYNDITITFLVSEGFTVHFSIFYLRIRQNGTNNSGNYNLSISLCELVGNLRDKVVAYYNNSTGNVQLWGNTGGQWDTMNYTVLKKTTRAATDSASLGTLTAQLFSSVQTPPSTGYSKVTMSGVGSVSYSDSTGSVHWNNVTNKPSSFTPSSHTHTWTSITDKIVVNNEFNIVNAGFKGDLWFNYLPINDRSKSATIKSYRFANGNMGYTSLVASGFIINGGTSQQLLRADGGVATFNWTGQSGQPTWLWGGNSQHSYYLYNPSNFRVAYAASAGNADTLDGEHASNFVRAGNFESSDLNKLDTYSFIKSAYSTNKDTSPKGNIGWYNVIQAVHRNGASDGPGYIGQIALGMTINTDDMFFRGKRTDPWKTVIHSGNIGSQSVAYASNADMVDGYHATSNNNKPWGTIPAITPSGFMDIGKHLEFHYDNTTGSDYSTALMCQGNYSNIVYLPTASGTLALTSQVLTWKSQIIDMRSYSESYWHPVTVPLPHTGYNKIKVSVQLNSGDKPSWATHSDGITCNMEIWATASGQGTTDSDTICLNYTYKFCSQNPCGWMQLGNPSLGVVFLRGGSRYTVYTDFDATFTPHNQKYTWSSGGFSQDTGGPYTSCPGLNFNMNTIRADLIATLVQARRVCAGHDPGIDNSISCSNWFRSSGNTGWYNTTYKGGWYMSDTSWIKAHNNVGIYTGGQIYAGSSIKMGSILLERTREISCSDNLLINYRSSTNVSLCNGGGNVGIGTISPTQKLDVNGNITTKGFGIQPCYLSRFRSLPTISPGDGYKYKCLEIGRTTDISCIIADRAGVMRERGILIKFNKGYDGQIILLKDLQSYGVGNGYFWVMPSGCDIIRTDGSGILIGQNQISDRYDDGRSRFLVYSSVYSIWIEFLCC